METLLWALRSRDPWGGVLYALIVGFFLWQADFPALMAAVYFRFAFRRKPDPFVACSPGRPNGLVIIPSLLRDDDDLKAIKITVESCAHNGYPAELVIIASVDGRKDRPDLYVELMTWIAARRYGNNVFAYVTGNETRLGKVMAIEAGIRLMSQLVAHGSHGHFPEVYFSCDGDGTLGDHALERLVDRLTTRHPVTGNMRRVVASKVCLRPELYWSGMNATSFKNFFTVKGQLYAQVAREFLALNVARYNWKITPKIGIPGGLYVTWSELFCTAPYYMAFMRTLTFRKWFRWWIGKGPPVFSEERPKLKPLYEAIAGATDDTCIAFLSCIASWKNGKLCYDAPRTPLHAIVRLVHQYIFERSHDYAPEARVFTYTPNTIKGLWTQRVRWNSARVECAGRFWRSFLFHWELGAPTIYDVSFVMMGVFAFLGYYLVLPWLMIATPLGLTIYVLTYLLQFLSFTFRTLFALALERQYKIVWPALLILPLSPLYHVCINTFGCVYGVVRDVFFLGNTTKFAPEWTLRKGGTVRVALLFRTRRFFALCVRAIVVGDVPWGSFWFGWKETPWTPSGFNGWTTDDKPRSIIPPIREWFRPPPARPVPKPPGPHGY